MTAPIVVRWRGDRLRERRLALGLSQARVADAVGVREITIARWEDGSEPRGMQALARLASLLECKIDELFECGVPAPPP